MGTHLPCVVPGLDICGNKKSGFLLNSEHLAYGPPRSSSQNQRPNTKVLVTQMAAAAYKSCFPLLACPPTSLTLSMIRLTAFDRLIRPINAIDTARRFLLSRFILRGFENVSGIRSASSSSGNRYLGPIVRFDGKTIDIAPAITIAAVAGNLCSCSDLNPNSGDSDGGI